MIKIADYVITDGGRFIYKNRTGKYVPATGEAMADVYTKKQADAIFQNCLPKALRTIFHIKKVRDDIPDTKPITKENIKQNAGKVMESEQIHIWIKKLENLNGLAIDALNRNEELKKDLSMVDKELTDIYHYLEFASLNACQLCKAAKMIKQRRIKRRSIKNEMEVIKIILEKNVGEAIGKVIKENIEKLDSRTYEPRVLTELFTL